MPEPYEYDDDQADRIAETRPTEGIDARRQRVLELLDIRPGETVLSIGCGSGAEPAMFASAVGEAGQVHGIDRSADVLASARDRCAIYSQVSFERADATQLSVSDESFDAAVVSLVYEYVPNVRDAVSELHRVLQPGGRAALVSNDWDSLVWRSTDVDRMNRIIERWTEAFAHPRLGSRLPSYVRATGFSITHVEPYSILSTDLETYSGLILELIQGKLSGDETVEPAELAEWKRDLRGLDDAGETFFNLTNYLFVVRKPE